MPQNTAEVIVKILVQAPGLREVSQTAPQATRRIQDLSEATRSAGREMYRYTFYAMWWSQVVNTYLGYRLIRGFVTAGRAAEDALARFQAIAQATLQELAEAQKQALDMVLAGLARFPEAVAGMEAMVRAGLEAGEAIHTIALAAKIARIEGGGLAETAEWLATAMIVFRMGVEEASVATDQFVRAAQLSKYSLREMRYALNMTMATASAAGMTFSELATILTAFGRAGFPGAQAATMINQVITRIGDPETMAFYEYLLDYYSQIPELMERAGGVVPKLWDVERLGLADIGEATVAVAEAINYALSQIPPEDVESRTEALRSLWLVLNRVFGIRNIRAFLGLAQIEYAGKTGVAAYRELRRAIEEAVGATEEVMRKLRQTYSMSVTIFRGLAEVLRAQIGGTVLSIFRPFVHQGSVLAATMVEILRAAPGLGQVVGLFLTLVTAISSATAAGMGFLIVYSLIEGRLRDIGSNKVVKDWLEKRGVDPKTISPARAGFMYILRWLGPTLSLIGSSVTLIGLGFLTWRYNLGGVQDRLRVIGQTLSEDVGAKAQELAERFKRFFGLATVDGRYTPPGAFFRGLGRGFLEAFGFIVKGGVETIGFLVKALRFSLVAIVKTIRAILYVPAFIVGLGNVEKGFMRMGKALGYLLSVLTTIVALNLLWRVAEGFVHLARTLWGFLVGRGGGLLRRAFQAFFIHGPGARLYSLILRPFLQGMSSVLRPPLLIIRDALKTGIDKLINFLRTEFIARLSAVLFARWIPRFLGWLTGLGGRLATWGTGRGGFLGSLAMIIGRWLARWTGELAAGGLGGVLRHLLTLLGRALATPLGLLLRGLISLGHLIIGRIAPLLGGLLGKALPFLGGLLGKILPFIGGAWPFVLGAAALGGLGYLIYRLVAAREAKGAELVPTTSATYGAYAPTNVTVNVSPTIVVPQGTTVEQAQAIVDQLTPLLVPVIVRTVQDHQYRRQYVESERLIRAHGLAAEVE